MKDASPEGPNWSYETQQDSFTGEYPRVQFVRASQLYDVETGARQQPEATDAQVRAAIFAAEGPDGRRADDFEVHESEANR